ncbi:class III poly(R)-hydroxyalkanoic acid synthase subunit PhaE [Pseudoxanthomonas kalamensis DSM 18571]|uniref:class III poly(R)-hydroxyalkanoic acid synthase subunit PhaE n=1 Tax=Pseudoxanthomonas kalamensis TaxID=289483 RepID=UPI0013918B21|nr:class III poly(R)-hydroxyalkanoic acid synthase subunit PhaE [Pseudoxanthomonas kalamensis]KAF1710608.1 class III poly(R)-hydroxyalkanoic acid synthase subunit PhaE [Pseudoxanthomonas kalamensis DSM 18571]
MFGFGTGQSGDFESLARQYWSAWGDALRQGGASGFASAQPNWQQAMQWWSQLVPGSGAGVDAMGAIHRFNQQASDWYGQMQQIAAQFAGTDSSADQIGHAWREAIGANAANGNPFADLFRMMQGQGQRSLQGWLDQLAPVINGMLESAGQQGAQWLHLPAFGPAREHEERWQALALAQEEYQKISAEYNAALLRVMEHALQRFEDKLAEHESPGLQLASARALFDLWIDAAEEAYAEAALSDEFRHLYGALSNAQMRLLASVQGEVERFCSLLGMPSRTEVDAAHRKINALERAMRKAARQPVAERRARPQAETRQDAPAPAEAKTAPPARRRAPRKTKPAATAKRSARKPARVAAPAKKRAIAKQAPKPTRTAELASRPAPKKTARKTAAKKPATKKSVAATKRVAVKKPAIAKAKPTTATRPTPRKPAKKKVSARPATAKKSAVARKPAAAKAAPGNVVSMKDWVARYVAAGEPASAKAASRNRKQGGRR